MHTIKPKKENTGAGGSCNHAEHKKWNRRSFLQALGIAGGGTMAFANNALSVSKPSPLSEAIRQVDNDRILVLVRLKGGNDGLNTIIPLYDYDTYAKARPTLGIKNNNLFKLNDDFGMPNYTNKLERLWGDGQMKVVHGVGYEGGSLSHFDGSDIWATADVNDQESRGWMGRYYQNLFPDYLINPPEKPVAIQIGSTGNLIFNGDDTNFSFAVADPKKLYEIAKSGKLYDVTKLPGGVHGDRVGYLKGVANATFTYAGVINDAYDGSTDFGNYPDNKLSEQLSIVSRLIKGNLGTKIYMVTLGGFDTHDDQALRHEKLMTELSESMAYFYDDLKNSGWDDKVLSMSISEFGRRVAENGSNGTDHGSASPMMLFGTGLQGNGFIGEHPDLSVLDRVGNLSYTTDFRNIYATVLKEWLCVNETLVDEVLLGKANDPVALGISCNTTLGVEDQIFDAQNFSHVVTYSEGQSFLHITNSQARHVDVKLYNMMGQEIATLKNEMLFEGKHVINVKEVAGKTLDSGYYIYRINTAKGSFSKTVMIN